MNNYIYLRHFQNACIIFMLASLVMSHKIIQVCGVQFSAASLIFPNTILITNIVAIVYGYEHSVKTMRDSLIAQIPFTIICFLGVALQPPTSTISAEAYNIVFKDLWQISLASILGTYIGFKVNIYALSKFSLLLEYRGFWLRTLFACGIGEFVFTLVAVPLMFIGKVPFSALLKIVITSVFVKIFYSSVLSCFSERVAEQLKRKEGIVEGAKSFSYDPFEVEAVNSLE